MLNDSDIIEKVLGKDAAEKLEPIKHIKNKIEFIDEKIAKEKKRHEEEIKKLNGEKSSVMKECKHEATKYYPDASGNNDSWTQCLICGGEVNKYEAAGYTG